MIGFTKSDSGLSDAQIHGAELILGVKFPHAYRETIKLYNDSHGDVDFPIPESSHLGCMGHWLSILPWDEYSIWPLLCNWSAHGMDKLIIPFGEDGGGNLICFDYRETPNPKVSLHYHEVGGIDGLCTIAPSFELFISSFTTPRAYGHSKSRSGRSSHILKLET